VLVYCEGFAAFVADYVSALCGCLCHCYNITRNHAFVKG
jgi:hypothetical protein